MTRINPLRLLVLLLILVGVAIYAQGQRLFTTNWATPVEVVVFPINGDGSRDTARYIAGLGDRNLRAIDEFFSTQSARYDLVLQTPFETKLGPTVSEMPPQPIPKPGDPWYSHMLWSLRFRLWAWQNTPDESSNYRRIRVFVVYRQRNGETRLPHSLGIQKGLLGLVQGYGKPESNAENIIVMAHEILHTVGATDKYTPEGYPVFPNGFADPRKEPLFPQWRAEIMAGTVAVSESRSLMPISLQQCVVGPETAREIGWINSDG